MPDAARRPSVPLTREQRTFSGLRRIVSTLRSAQGCPWDRAQTHRSLRPYLLEEVSEALEALDSEDTDLLREELGDLLLEILLHVQIAEEAGEFRLGDVIQAVSEKLVRRHPHVFADATAETADEVMSQWDELKRVERGGESALHGIPHTLPALAYAQSLQRRAAKAGFAFESVDEAWDGLREELDELREAESPEQRREEVGDALFALANLACWLDADAEDSLRATSRGFRSIFEQMEVSLEERGTELNDLNAADRLALWGEAKRLTKEHL